jgi:hypothetical protein
MQGTSADGEGADQRFKGWALFNETRRASHGPEQFCMIPIMKMHMLLRENETNIKQTAQIVSWRFIAGVSVIGGHMYEPFIFFRCGYGEAYGEHLFDRVPKLRFAFA